MASNYSPADAVGPFTDRAVNMIGETFASDAAIGYDDGDGPLIAHHHVDAFAVLEPLEARQMMSVSMDDAGWTVVAPAEDSRVIYVSSSAGADGNSGFSASSPVKTLARAISLVRDNSADQILLKRGDAWNDSFGRWTKSGRSEQEPLLISAYGLGSRPLLKTGTDDGIVIGGTSARTVDHVAIIGLHFWANGRDPSVAGFDKTVNPYGIGVTAGGTGLVIEDCEVEKYQTNITFVPVYGEQRDLTVRRNVITDAYSVNKHAQGLFLDGVRGVLVEENTFDHNGWAEDVAGAEATKFNHNAYITGKTSGVVVKRNVFANGGNYGLQARSGGVVVGNLFVNNWAGMSFGLVNGQGVQKEGGVRGEVRDNVFVGGRVANGVKKGTGLEIANVRAGGTVVSGNIFASNSAGVMPAIILTSGVGRHQADAVGITDVTIKDNIVYKWAQGVLVQSGMSATASLDHKKMSNVKLEGNTFAGLTGPTMINAGGLTVRGSSDDASGFDDPGRTIQRYDAALGGPGSLWHFLTEARQQAKGNWDTRYTAKCGIL